MTPDPTQVSHPLAASGQMTTAEIIDRLSRFDGPPEQFLVTLLSVQCRLASAQAGTILRAGQDGKVELLAIFPQLPQGTTAPVWLAQAVESSGQVLSGGKTVVRPIRDADALYGQPAQRHLVMMPILASGSVRGVAAYYVESGEQATLAHCRERLELSISLLSLYEMRLTLQRRQFDLGRLRLALETLSAANEHDRFAGAGMAFCNEVASRWSCDRVALGFLKGRYVHLKALSHTEKINRKMQLVQDIESAMEECLDQDIEILYPQPEETIYVCRSAQELSRRNGPMTVISLPLRRGGEVVGVVTAERNPDNPFTLEEIEAFRLTCDLCTARLVNLHENDRWLGARLAGSTRKSLAMVIGPKHTWVKVAVVAVFAFLMFTVLVDGDYTANASFVLEAKQQSLIPAPFDGYIDEVLVRPGDKVVAGETVLARLRTVQLEQELIQAQADHAGALTEASTALRDGKIAEAQIARSKADKANAQIELLETYIVESSIKSPISGTVISPDMTRRILAHVKIGEPMFEVAPIEQLRAELSVPEDEIADVVEAFRKRQAAGEELRGELATEGKPGEHIEFVVERIEPVAEVVEKENVFKVRVRLIRTHEGMLPGAAGVAKIHIGERKYAYLWTRKLVNWVRMKLWL